MADRGRGQGSLYKPHGKKIGTDAEGQPIYEWHSKKWHCAFWHNGRHIRMSTGEEVKQKAEAFLRKQMTNVSEGKQPLSDIKKITYETLRDGLYADYRMNKQKSMVKDKAGNQYLTQVKPLDEFFANHKASSITTAAIKKFILQEQTAGKADATINRSLSALKRMFNIAVEAGQLQVVPYIPMLEEAQPRQGFLEPHEFDELRDCLPDYLKALATVAYFEGCRRGELLKLEWSDVDLKAGKMTLRHTKNGKPRPIRLTPQSIAWLQLQSRGGQFVFGGKEPIGDFRKAWAKAVKKARLPKTLFHDLRRSGARNMVRSGVPESVAMTKTGHLTRSVFDRYNISSERDQELASQQVDAYYQRQMEEAAERARIAAEQAALEASGVLGVQ